ncbi:MAG: hypothetical protein KKC58_13320 [Gammaproteobacteria bacterium]|nr:hypothetical protein [Gammaproteobacteria bacterium]
MIFAVSTDDRSLMTFATEADAVGYCEGLDVEAAIWLFWDNRGEPLEPHFSVPNKRGFFGVVNGVYSLVPAGPDHHAVLDEALEEVLAFEGSAPFNSAEGIRSYLRGQRVE